MAQKLTVLVMVRDLIFATRIDATARAEGVTITLLRDPSRLRDAEGTRLILDLNEPGALDEVAGHFGVIRAARIPARRFAGTARVQPWRKRTP